MNISEVTQQGVKFFIYGGPGTGKTVFASKLPKPIYFFDFDKGLLSAANFLASSLGITVKELATNEAARIDFDVYRDSFLRRRAIGSVERSMLSVINTSPRAYLQFENKINSIFDACESAQRKASVENIPIRKLLPYQTVVIDSLSTFSVAFLAYIMSVNADQGRVFAVPNQNDYGNFVRKMEEILLLFHSLSDYGVHTVITAHLQIKEDMRGPKDDKVFLGVLRTPAIVGKDPPYKLGGFFDEYYYSKVERSGGKIRYLFETKSDTDLFCKSRSDKMPMVVEQDWDYISKLLSIKQV